ncbi:MAG: NAD(+) synthase [Erysipelotrichaceae bacterium]
MKIAMIQMNVNVLEFEVNYNNILKYIIKAKADKADMVILPAHCIGGFLLGEHYKNNELMKLLTSYNDLIAKEAKDIAIVWGNIKAVHNMIFDCIFFSYNGNTQMSSRTLNTNNYMNEYKYLNSSEITSNIVYKDMVFHLNLGILTSNDGWNINLTSSSYPNQPSFTNRTICVNSLGSELTSKNVIVYNGGSFIYGDNKYLTQLPYSIEHYELIELESSNSIQYMNCSRLTALLQGIRDFDRICFGSKLPWIIGLSGGLDSSLSAALLVKALGSERVIGYNLATHYNSECTKNNANYLADKLNIKCIDGSIEKLVEATNITLEEYGYPNDKNSSLTNENIQARLRGHLLSSFASVEGGVVVNNGNKVEVALGYCTMYGDSIGAVSPLGDLTKVDIFEICRELNAESVIIPESLLPTIDGDKIEWIMPPSAELKDKQLDPMKWFYHDQLLNILMKEGNLYSYLNSYLDESIKTKPLYKWIKYYGLDNPIEFVKDIKWFTRTIQRNIFKRVQLPPCIVMSKHPFGSCKDEVQGNYTDPIQENILKEINNMK